MVAKMTPHGPLEYIAVYKDSNGLISSVNDIESMGLFHHKMHKIRISQIDDDQEFIYFIKKNCEAVT